MKNSILVLITFFSSALYAGDFDKTLQLFPKSLLGVPMDKKQTMGTSSYFAPVNIRVIYKAAKTKKNANKLNSISIVLQQIPDIDGVYKDKLKMNSTSKEGLLQKFKYITYDSKPNEFFFKLDKFTGVDIKLSRGYGIKQLSKIFKKIDLKAIAKSTGYKGK